MVKALGKRLGALALVLFFVTLFTALLISMVPGNPVDTLLPFRDDGSEMVQEAKADMREDMSLDEPLPVRYGEWLQGFVTGDFGNYYRRSGNVPVSDELSSALPASLQLMAYSQILALVVAIPLGVVTAYRAGSWFDRFSNTGAFALLAIPNFVLALVLAYYVGVWLGWLPPQGYVPFGEDPVEHIRLMILPAIAVGASQVAVYMRLLRSDMVATLQEDFVQMARSKGISDRRVLWRHALRPSSVTLLTVAGLNIGNLIGGALIIEVLFSIPGLGSALFDAITERQYVALQTFVAVIAIIYVVANVLVDVLHTALDPRIRHARAS